MRDKFQVEVPLGRRYIGSEDKNRAAPLDRQDLLIAQETYGKEKYWKAWTRGGQGARKGFGGRHQMGCPERVWSIGKLSKVFLGTLIMFRVRHKGKESLRREEAWSDWCSGWSLSCRAHATPAHCWMGSGEERRCRHYSDLTSRYCQDSK